jgi:UDP-3-O-[3-hydroxymyristoyl] N-acetylglucosamine deacetylase
MFHCHQKTIKQRIQISGKGLHSGEMMDVVLSPKPINTGIWFQRTDRPGNRPVPASAKNVTDTILATTIGEGHSSIATVEHLLAALGGLGINNLLVEVHGPEVPILDGSALPWVELFKTVGLQTLNAPCSRLVVRQPFEMVDGDRSISVAPASDLSVDFTIDFPGYIRSQKRHFTFSEAGFVHDIAPARTFCLLSDVRRMQAQGKALGGGLDNAVVLSDQGVLNPEGLRFEDECVRHKILDFIGDMTLAGAQIVGRFQIRKSGHALNQRFLSALLSAPGVLEARLSGRGEEPTSFKPIPRLAPALEEAWALS